MESVNGWRFFGASVSVFTGLIYIFYMIILYFNGSPLGITPSEAAGLLAALAVVAAVSVLIYAVYRMTLLHVCKQLAVRRPKGGQ